MKILLTGSTGFIGSAFLERALAAGHSFALLIPPGEELLRPMGTSDRLRLFPGTLAEAPWLEIAKFGPEVCVHAAWITTPGVYLESPENDRFLEWSRAFFEQFYRHGGAWALGLGTCIEYASTSGPRSEAHTPIEPASRYARSKNSLRVALEEIAARHGRPAAWARIFYPYGPGEHPSRLGSQIVLQLLRNQSVTLRTPDAAKDYIYISDLARAILTVVERRFAGAINLGTGQGVTVRQFAEQIAACLGKTGLIHCLSGHRDPAGDVIAAAARIRGLGWEPQVGLGEGIAQLVAHVQRSRSITL